MATEENPAQRLDAAIADTKLTLFILERRKEGTSFAMIGKECGMSKSACYERFIRACNRKGLIGGVDTVDGTYVE